MCQIFTTELIEKKNMKKIICITTFEMPLELKNYNNYNKEKILG